KIGFFNFIFILHAGVPRLIEKAWSDTGMEQRSPITAAIQSSSHIIFFEKLTPDHAVLLIKKYLSEYRIKSIPDNDPVAAISPFTKEAIYRIGELTELNAAGILQKANHLLETAVDMQVTTIDEQFVQSVLTQSKTIEEESSHTMENDDSID